MSDVFFLSLPNARIAYRLHENPNATSDAACLMLHGAGVAGDITFSPMLPYLTPWRWMLIPDLKGMGDSFHADGQEKAVSVADLTAEVMALLDHVNWTQFDLVAYSLGGLVALNLNYQRQQAGQPPVRMALLEPASLDREDLSHLKEVRQKYRHASQLIRETGDVELGVACFMDGVSPNRRKHPVAEATTQSRLAHRPFGFAYALDAVTDFVEQAAHNPHVRHAMIEASPEVFLFSGELSHEALKQHYELLSERNAAWQHTVMSACDHSLPFQKPRQIAKHLNKWFASP
ncbi:alpha/beta fold hydrolase [Marinomonas aquiplantarum]|uniref:Pimeloyl-ACP methyl ester carboxylesterase n=1 Tax=Marinomonas aquiplantarum TaxID=491951 RepID=A0A366CYP3_9GAMM|nr:alpha/beta hydrolase [Marinomonas aquiplantarum]RBO82354.1 pimeloyl-ACP methyl ester carboxylesterase [Marinomonas aquiplantarum]